MSEITARDYPHVYKSLGIDLNQLGCIMVDTEAIPVTEMVTKADLDLYVSPDPEHFWINGATGENGAHLTVLYGLIQAGPSWKAQVDEVLRGWSLDTIEIEKVGSFDSMIAGEDYVCIVGHVKVTPAVLEGHQRLSLLPHVNTFGQYHPHVTLAYVKPDAKRKWLRELGNELTGKKLSTLPGLNYGGNPK